MKVYKELYKLLLILLLLPTIATAQISLSELLQAYGVPYIILPSPEEPVIITTTGKITHTTHTRTAISDTKPSQQVITATETSTQITERTAFILHPIPIPTEIDINPTKTPPLDIILKLLSDRIHYTYDKNILVIKNLWKLQNLLDSTEPPKTGTYEELLSYALNHLKQKPPQKDLKPYYSLIQITDLLKICELNKIQCIPFTDEIILAENTDILKPYLTDKRPRVFIKAYIMLLSSAAHQELEISLSTLISQARIPQFFNAQIKDRTLQINIQRGILNALELKLNALTQKNQASIIASPSLLLDDRQTAEIRQGYEIPVITPATQNTPATTTYRNAYLFLKVQPVILPNGKVRINLYLAKDSPDFTQKIGENIPIFTNAINTTITTPLETPILLGGITEETNNNRKSYGFLFFSKEKGTETRQLYILLYTQLLQEENLTLTPQETQNTDKPKTPTPEPEPEISF